MRREATRGGREGREGRRGQSISYLRVRKKFWQSSYVRRKRAKKGPVRQGSRAWSMAPVCVCVCVCVCLCLCLCLCLCVRRVRGG